MVPLKRIRMIGICGLLFVSLMSAAASSQDSQITARQGSPEQEANPVQEFESPMVLELPLPDLRKFARGYAKTFSQELQGFVCEDSSIAELTVSRGKTSGRGNNAETSIDLEGIVYVRPSYDRLADLELSLVKDDRTIATATIRGINAEEDYRTKFKTRLKLSLQDFEGAFDGKPSPKLKIMMSVMDND